MLYETEGDQSGSATEQSTARWDMEEGLTHVSEEEEHWEAGQASFLSSNLEHVVA
jgi:hypothetical protein